MKLFDYELLSPNNFESTYNYKIYKLSYWKRALIKLVILLIALLISFCIVKLYYLVINT